MPGRRADQEGRMTPVVIAGASGFLGRHLAAGLAGSGLNVIMVSRQSVPGMCQVTDYSDCPEGDVLIHLAEEPDRAKVNRLGENYARDSLAVAKALSRRCSRMIYASSGVVYGDYSDVPFTVDMPVVDSDVYSHSKLLNERVVLDAGGAVVRLSNLIGHGMAVNNVVSDIVRQIPGSGPVRVRDDQSVRDFLHVADAASAIGRLIGSACSGVLNVGSGVGTSVRTLAEIALAAAGQEGREIVATDPASRRSVNVLDIAATTRALGWSPSSSLRERIFHLINNRADPAS